MTVTKYSGQIFRGLSVDTKPSASSYPDSLFIEIDTSKTYQSNGMDWIQIHPDVGYGFSTFLYKDAGGKCYAVKADGNLISRDEGTDDSEIISEAVASTPPGGSLCIWPGMYYFGGGSSRSSGDKFHIVKDISIFGYGATIKGVRNPASNYYRFFEIEKEVSFRLFGLTLNFGDPWYDVNDPNPPWGERWKKNVGAGITGGHCTEPLGSARDFSFKYLQVVDCNMLNVWAGGIGVFGAGGIRGTANSTLVVENCFFDHGIGNQQNEAILCGSIRSAYIRNVSTRGNKIAYVSARTINIENVSGNTNGTLAGYGICCHGENISIRNIHLIGNSLAVIRPWSSVHYSVNYGVARSILIDGVHIERYDGGGGWFGGAIQVQGLDDFYGIENLDIRNVNLEYGHIRIDTPADDPVAGRHYFHSKVRNCNLTNVHIRNFDDESVILDARNTDFDNLHISDCTTSPYPDNTRSPIKIISNKLKTIGDEPSTPTDVIICSLDMQNIIPLPAQNIVTVDSLGTANRITINFVKPLSKGTKGVKVGGNTANMVNFYENYGLYTNNGGLRTYCIKHNIVDRPSFVMVVAGSADASGNFSVASDATNINVTYAASTPVGSNNIKLYWNARE
jgi:hypothetical protein